MTEQQWYYWHETEILGPFSGKQLADLAKTGELLPDDIVWQDGVEDGVSANKVRHLFPPVPDSPQAESATATEDKIAAPGDDAPKSVNAEEPKPTAGSEGAKEAPPVKQNTNSGWGDVRSSHVGKARAVAGTGTIIVGQDGKSVKFRMKCTTCGCEDRSWQTRTITRGTSRFQFYCPKCRKRCQVEIHGYVS